MSLHRSPRLRAPASGSSLRVGRVSAACAVLLTAATAASARPSDPPLIDAVRRGDAAAVRTLIAGQADIDAAQGDGVTALFWAVHRDDHAITDLLLRAGAQVNVADDTAATPLYVACTNGSARLVRTLLDAGADPNATLLHGETVLMHCARTGDPATVRALVAAGAAVDAREGAHDQTALMWAAAEAHPAAVAALIEAGADVGARSRAYLQTVTAAGAQRPEGAYNLLRGGSTPLHFAARSGDAESARRLLAAGADPDATLADGMNAITLAAYSGHGGVGAVLLDHGADPNGAATGYAALHAAVLRGDEALVQALLARGADPDARLMRGTPIRRQTADLSLRASQIGATPYLLAAEFLEADIMRALVAGGADAGLVMPDGTTALMLAAGLTARTTRNRRGVGLGEGGTVEDEALAVEAVRAALEPGAHVNARNLEGETALHGAAGMGYDDVIRLLVVEGALVDVETTGGVTPLALASRAGERRGATSFESRQHPSTVALLRRLGATR